MESFETALRRSVSDPAEFEDFYRDHAEALLGFFMRRIMDRHVALDLTAETFASAFAHRGRFRGRNDREAAGWLYKIASNQVAGYLRAGQVNTKMVQRLGLSLPQYSPEDLDRVDELTGIEGLRADVARRFGDLPDAQRAAVGLRVIDELPYPEVARRLGVTEQAARARVSRGLSVLRNAMTPQEEELA